jgi:hypothetical protein
MDNNIIINIIITSPTNPTATWDNYLITDVQTRQWAGQENIYYIAALRNDDTLQSTDEATVVYYKLLLL